MEFSGGVALTLPSSAEFGLEFCGGIRVHTADSGVEKLLTGDFGGRVGPTFSIHFRGIHFRGDTGGPFFEIFCKRDCSSCSLVIVPTWMMDVEPFGVVEFCIVDTASISEMAEITAYSAPKLDRF